MIWQMLPAQMHASCCLIRLHHLTIASSVGAALGVLMVRWGERRGVACFEMIRRWDADDSAFMWGFDLIELNGDDLRRDPLAVRKATLASVLERTAPGLRFNEHIEAITSAMV
jgi:hypothetical protein